MGTPPTIAEVALAKRICLWHGQTVIVYGHPDLGTQTVASLRGSRTQFGYELDNYVSKHWHEYLGAARDMIRFRGEY